MKRFIALIFAILFVIPPPALAYLPLKQSDWSGGYGQQVWSNPTKFKENYHIDYSTKGELKIPGNDTWYDSSWKYRRKITINNTDQGELDHFPVLVVLEHKINIDYEKLQDNGNDIRFTDSNGTTLLPHDIERWDQLGKSYLWVKIPTINDHSNQDYFYMYYGNPIAKDKRNPGEVFDNKFVMVQHLTNKLATGGTEPDATTQHTDGIYTNPDNEGGAGVEGQIAGAVDFQGTNDTINLASNASKLTGFTKGSVMAWFKSPLVTGGYETIFSLTDGEIGGNDLANLSLGNWTGAYNNESVHWTMCTGGDCTNQLHMYVRNGHNAYLDNKWHQVILSIGNGDNFFYVDGNRQNVTFRFGSSTSNHFTNINNVTAMDIGGRVTGTTDDAPFRGLIDEVRVTNSPVSGEWAKAEYKSQTNSYLSFGDEELFNGELLSSVLDAGYGTNWGYLSYTATEPTNTAVKIKIRTGDNPYLADAIDFTQCNVITNKSDISSNNCVKDGNRYIQYQVILDSTEINKTPIFKDIAITDYLPSETKPVVLGVSSVIPSPSPLRSEIYDLESAAPKPAPKPSPSPNQLEAKKPNPISDFFEALFH